MSDLAVVQAEDAVLPVNTKRAVLGRIPNSVGGDSRE
jgi:hypothetical protein